MCTRLMGFKYEFEIESAGLSEELLGESDHEEENDTNVSQVSSEVIGVSSSHSQEKAGGGTGFGMGARGRSMTQLGLGTCEVS